MTCRRLKDFYHINGHLFGRQYKEILSGLRQWEQLDHADELLLLDENIGPHLAIDDSSLFNGELNTLVTMRDAWPRKQSLVVMVDGTRSEYVISVLEKSMRICATSKRMSHMICQIPGKRLSASPYPMPIAS